MNLKHLFATISLMAGMATNLNAAILTPDIEKDFQSRRSVIEHAGGLSLGELKLSKDQEDCLKMLYTYMPLPDMTDRSPEYYLEYVVNPALDARAEMPWGKSVDDTLFRHFVLPVRVNNEALDNHRPEFYAELKNRVKGLSMRDAILEVNHWCHEKVTYQPSDGRTHSPLQSVSSAIGRCGEESTFTVAALRSVGIPARQVYTPRWAHTDDNHAWVEAWAEGKWYFLGACEPEPVLNLGWFNAPASRGMLMHARVFGNYSGGEEQLEKIEGITFINVTDNYAPVDTITVTAIYPDNKPAVDAKATFRLYNYAEFYPIAEKMTDSKGNASLIAGMGDLLIWVTDGTNFGYGKCSVGKDKNIKVVLDKTANTPFSIDLDIVPPAGRNADIMVSDSERAQNDARLKAEDALRNAYMATFLKDEESYQLAQGLGLDTVSVADIMKKARGNHAVICNFLNQISPEDRPKAITLLQSLTEKDLSDVTIDVLTDHIRAIDFSTGENFGPFVMSPRIEMEELTPYRIFFGSAFADADANIFRNNPKEWVKWVADSIVANQTWYPQQIAMSPESVWKNRKTSSKSRDLFFVAGARSFGIPARVDAVTGKTQWADKSGNWIDATFSVDSADNISGRQGLIKMDYTPTPVIPDPKYYSNFTLSKIVEGEPVLLNYPDFITLSETFEKGEKLDHGSYIVVTGQRMADGGVLARIETIKLDSDTVIVPLTIRHDDTKLQVIGSFDSESMYLPQNSQTESSILSTTGRGYYVLALLKANHEPSNHVIRDIAQVKQALTDCGRPIVFLSEDSGQKEYNIDMSVFPELPEVVSFGCDTGNTIRESIMENLNISSPDLPIIIIADSFNRVVFLSQGYTIGIGEKISSILQGIQ